MSVALIAIHALAAVGLPVSLGKQRRRSLAALHVAARMLLRPGLTPVFVLLMGCLIEAAVRRRENKPHREEA